MKKFFKSIKKKSPGKSGLPTQGSPKLDQRSTASPVIGYDVREKELGKLHKAAWTGDFAKVQQLAKKDPSPIDKEKRTPLHLACAKGHDNVVQELLEWKAKTNIGDANSCTPLMKAVECGHEKCVVLLLQDRVELDSVDKDGNTALHIAAKDGASRIVKMLCQSGANMALKNKEGLAPLHLAVKEKHEETCRIIISFKGQIDIEDNNLRTPLMYACQDGSVSLVKLFLEHGASTSHKDAKGWLADDCALIHGHHACSQLISDHMLRHMRGSTSSTPRSTAGTPRGPSPFTLPPDTPKDPSSASFGLPAADAGGDDSGDETLSKASAKGAGSDSWGDDTDISLAEDKKGKGAGARVNLAKLLHLPSEGDDGDGGGKTDKGTTGGEEEAEEWMASKSTVAKLSSTKSYQAEISQGDNSWAAVDSPLSPRRHVSFKGDKELSEVHNITATESEAESDQYITVLEPPQQFQLSAGAQGYTPTGASVSAIFQLSPDKQRAGPNKGAFMDDLGLGDADDISEFSDPPSEVNPTPVKITSSATVDASAIKTVATAATSSNSDSEWDSTIKSDHPPKPGILKKLNKVEDDSDWDMTEAEEITHRVSTSHQPPLIATLEGETDVDEVMVMGAASSVIPKEDNDFLDMTPQHDLLDKPSQDSEWDSTVDAPTPRNNVTTAVQLPSHQESDWDSTAEAVTPRASQGPHGSKGGMTVDKIKPKRKDSFYSDDDDDMDEIEDLVMPASPAQQSSGGGGGSNASSVASGFFHPQMETAVEVKTVETEAKSTSYHKASMEPDIDIEEEESAWDSDGDTLPSDQANLQQTVDGDGKKKAMTKADSTDTDSHDDDDMEEKTESVSEWEFEQKRIKEEKLKADQEAKRQKEEEESRQQEGRLQQEKKQLEEERRKQEEEEEKCRKEEEEEKRREEERQEEESRHQQWEREEEERVHRLKAEAEMALKEESFGQHTSDSSEEESLAHEELDGLGHPDSPNQVFADLVALNSCQNNSRVVTQDTVTTTRTQVTSGEELKKVERQSQEEYITSTQASKTRAAAGVVSGSGYGSLHPQQSQGMPQPSQSTGTGSYLTGPTALQIKQRLQIGTSLMACHGDGMESDESFTTDVDRIEAQSSYPALLASTQSFRPDFNMADDDVLSYTSTEFEANEPTAATSGPFIRDVLLNMNLSDPSTLVQVQDYIREMKRHVDQERNQCTVLDNKLRIITKEKQDLSRKLEGVTEAKQSLEQNKLDLEARIRSLEYSLSEEQEKKRSAEMLLSKTKEQLSRKEEQFTNELEGKQRAELIKRNIELEMKAAQNTIKDLEEEKDELERQLQSQIEHSHRLQDQLKDEQHRIVFLKHQETLASSAGSASLRMQDKYHDDDDDGEEEDRSDRHRLNKELYAVRMELERKRSHFIDEVAYLTKENEDLQNRIEQLKNEIKLNEEALAHATMQYNVHMSALRTEATNCTTAFEKEHSMREKLETELDSVQKRLHVAVTEKDRAVQARNDLERHSQLEKQNHCRDLERKEEEVAILKESSQHLNHRIQTLEAKLSSAESEMHVSSTSLLERTNQLQLLRQEAERHRSAHSNYDTNLRAEKELNTKLQVKIESLQERLSQSQMEVTSLRQQVENLHIATLNTSASDPHEHLSAVINTLRSDSDRTKAMLEERNSSLLEQVQQLKEELRNSHNRHASMDADLRRLHTEHAELTHKLSFAEAQLQLLQKAKEQLEQERNQLKGEVQKAGEKHRQAHEKFLEAQARLTDMTDRLDRAEKTSQLSTQHLATTSASFTAVTRSKEEMEDTVQRLQMENALLDTDLRHERERIQMLQAELADSRKVRDSLETLCSNLKSTSAHLEEKLGEETAFRVVLSHQARDRKQLLKQEMATRSALGLKAKTEGNDVKEQKQAVEAELLAERQRNQQLQKEVANLKSYLKVAKKKIKAKVENGTADLDALRVDLEMKYRRDLNRKLEEVNSYLETQALARDRLESSRTENETRLSTDKRRLEEENNNLKLQYQQALAQRESSDMEARRFRQLYESEMHWRMRLSDQLMQFSSASKASLLAEHKSRLFGSSSGLVNKSALSDVALNLSSHSNQGLSNKIQAELDRSIARHLEASPHSDIVPLVRMTEDSLLSQSLTRSSKDYIDILKRKYCVL